MGGRLATAMPARPDRRSRHVTEPPAWLRSTRFAFIAALVLSIGVVSAWAVATPAGSTPDESYHLVSIWCADGLAPGACDAASDPDIVRVPAEVLAGACTLGDAARSGACASDVAPGARAPAPKGSANFFSGHYPNGYYRIAHRVVSENATASIIAIRILNGYLCVALVFFTIALVRVRLRIAVILAWMGGVVPLGLFMIPSVNPTSWAVTGAGLAWAPSLALAEERDFRRRVGLLLVLSLCILMALLSRLDALFYVAIGIAVGLGLSPRVRSLVRRHRLVAAATGAGLGLFVVMALLLGPSAQSSFATNALKGFTSGGADLFFANVSNLPNLWAGSFGTWGLGPLDTGLPAAVWILSLFAASGLVFFGLRRMWPAKAVSLGVLGVALIAIPLLTLQSRGDPVGQFVQPRYLLPLVLTALGVAIFGSGTGALRFGRAQLTALVIAWTAAAGFAMHQLMRRYITGLDVNTWNLNAGVEWWWGTSVSPLALWLFSTAAFGALAILAVVYVRRAGSSSTPAAP
jgi:hypothetical protein